MRKVTARRAGAAVARRNLRQFDREMKALDKQAAKTAKPVQPVVEQVQSTELVERPAEIKTVEFEMNGKQYRTVSSWSFLD